MATTPLTTGRAHYTDVYVLTLFGPFAFTDIEDFQTGGRLLEYGSDTWSNAKHIGDWIVPDDWNDGTEAS